MFARQDDENGGWGNKADIIALTIHYPRALTPGEAKWRSIK